MLVIVSDLHLTDGTTGLRISEGAFRLFRQRLEDMAYDASKRDEDKYKPIEEVDLLLLGDIFDLLRSTQWNKVAKGDAGYARPWSDPNSPAFVKKVDDIVEGIFAQNAKSLEILRRLADGTAISLPPATSSHKVDRRVSRDRRSKSRIPVRVNIHYMNGNHDWIFHLPGTEYGRIRQKVIDQMGLRNDPTPFPYEPSEAPKIQSVLAQHSVFARHGDFHDQFNFVQNSGRNTSSLGDAIVVEIFNPFPKLVEEELINKLPKRFFDDLREMGSVRPSTMTPVWIASKLEQHKVSTEQKKKIDELWRNLIENFLRLDFLNELDQPWKIDAVDWVQLLMNVLKRVSFERLDDFAPIARRVINFHNSLTGGDELGFEKQAGGENALMAEEAQFIVYGHTHEFKVIPLRSITKNGKALDQLYLNSGTWHPWHEPGLEDKRHFITHHTMSYVGFFRDDERKGRKYETWNGVLDV